ncbi:MAG: HAD family phosphatase [Oscillospiraceae bacterium]|nr:HAD family phosphatase [Oscillospiraceae bacterium]
MQEIKGVIFDLDGTLIDSMWIWGDVAEKYVRSHGGTPSPTFREELRTLNTTEEAQYYIDKFGVNLPVEEVIIGRDDMMLEHLKTVVQLKTGVMQVLKELKKRGIRICIATATERRLVEPSIERHGLGEYIEHIFTCTEENTSKSSPDIYFQAAEFLGTDINQTLVVEDALYAMKTAKEAGFVVAGVYDKVSDDEQDEIKSVCDYYWITLDEMLAHF